MEDIKLVFLGKNNIILYFLAEKQKPKKKKKVQYLFKSPR
jgi:hypothetical protein